MICEPIVFQFDDEGRLHLPEGLPLKTIVDVHNLAERWMKVEQGRFIIELDGRTVVYEFIGLTPEGHWVCRLRVDPATIYAQQS